MAEDEGIRDLRRALEEISDACGRAVEAGTKAGVAAVASAPKFTSRTGTLAKGVAYVAVRTRGGASGGMKWPAPYATFVRDGTEPHEIHPKLSAEGPLRGARGSRQTRRTRTDVGTSRVKLRFAGPNGWIFAAYVKHPGTKATDFTEPAEDACVKAALEEVVAAVFRAQAIVSAP